MLAIFRVPGSNPDGEPGSICHAERAFNEFGVTFGALHVYTASVNLPVACASARSRTRKEYRPEYWPERTRGGLRNGLLRHVPQRLYIKPCRRLTGKGHPGVGNGVAQEIDRMNSVIATRLCEGSDATVFLEMVACFSLVLALAFSAFLLMKAVDWVHDPVSSFLVGLGPFGDSIARVQHVTQRAYECGRNPHRFETRHGGHTSATARYNCKTSYVRPMCSIGHCSKVDS